MSTNNGYPMAEVFTSIHGEGFYAGTPMTFWRFAGCSVGRYIPPDSSGVPLMPILSTGRLAWRCTTFDGRHFPCDTDFNLWKRCTQEELLTHVPAHIRHVCITGGEPLMHQALFEPLIQELYERNIMTHVETSGTIMPVGRWPNLDVYFACAPKADCREEFIKEFADELRILVDPSMEDHLDDILTDCLRWSDNTRLYFAPISDQNDVDRLDQKSMELAVHLAHRVPGSRVSIQMHKVLNVR